MGFGERFTGGRSADRWIDEFLVESEIPDVDEFMRTGAYFAPEQDRVGLADFARDPVTHPLGTPSGLVELESVAWERDTGRPAIPTWRGAVLDPLYPLLLVTPKRADRTHSQGGDRSGSRFPADHALDMNAAEAAARGVVDGDEVIVRNGNGWTRVRVRLADGLMAGVVSLPEGTWHEGDGSGGDLVGSPNVLTSTDGGGPALGAVMHGVPVEVERA
ncbi:MAG: hypothetical protein NT080_08770 [Spirochaetes bacterium]|nr:hypothetical protein [Spirochaetota bacterium]